MKVLNGFRPLRFLGFCLCCIFLMLWFSNTGLGRLWPWLWLDKFCLGLMIGTGFGPGDWFARLSFRLGRLVVISRFWPYWF